MSENREVKTLEDHSDETSADQYRESYYNQSILQLRVKREENIEGLFEARWNKLQYFAPSLREISDWIEDAGYIRDKGEKIGRMVEIYEMIVVDMPVVYYWKMYLTFALDLYREGDVLTKDQMKELFTRALHDCVFDYKSSHEIWEMFLAFFYDIYETSHNDKDRDTLLKLHLKCISYPHQKLEDSFSRFSSVVSKVDNSNYEAHMKAASAIYSKSLRKQTYYDEFEIQLSRSEEKPEIWCSYLEQVSRYAQTVEEFSTLFERSVYSQKLHLLNSESWTSVWLTYIYILYERDSQDVIENVLAKFVRNLPNSSVSYAEYITNCSLFDDCDQKFDDLRLRIDRINLMSSDKYENWKTLALAIINYEYDAVKNGRKEFLKSVYSDTAEFTRFAVVKNNDIYHSVEKLSVEVMKGLGDIDQATKYINELVDQFKDQYEVWMYAIGFIKRSSDEYEDISNLFSEAVENILSIDWPERLIEEWLGFERVHGDLKKFRMCLVEANKILKRLGIQRIEKDTKTNYQAFKLVEKTNDTSRVEDSQLQSRSRETFTVKVSNLSSKIKRDAIEKFFEACGLPKTIKFSPEIEGKVSCLIEFSNEQEVLSALSRDRKFLNGSELRITRNLGSILFVSNYPPAMTQNNIRGLFSDLQGFLDIRFPVQKGRKARRFCYVEFDNSDSAALAQSILNDKVVADSFSGKEYKLKVQFSNPEKSSEPNEDGVIEVHVGNLNHEKVDESVLRDVFKDCGDIDRITIPLPTSKREEGFVNNGFAFIRFKSKTALDPALDLNRKNICGTNISVSKAASTKLTPYDFDDPSTIALFNLNTTTSSAQIRSQLSKLVGPIKKIELYTDLHSALVEFVHPRDAGKADLVLPSTTMDGQPLKTGSRTDFLNSYKNSKQSTHNETTKNSQSAKRDSDSTGAKLRMVPTSLKRRRK